FRHVDYLLYGIVLVRYGFIDLQTQYLAAGVPETLPLGEYLLQLVQRLVMFGVPIGSLGGAYVLLRQPVPAFWTATFTRPRATAFPTSASLTSGVARCRI